MQQKRQQQHKCWRVEAAGRWTRTIIPVLFNPIRHYVNGGVGPQGRLVGFDQGWPRKYLGGVDPPPPPQTPTILFEITPKPKEKFNVKC